MTRQQLIRLIHVAKKQLNLDDDTYCAKLLSVTGKASCADMQHNELKAVYASFVEIGFKRRFKKVHSRVKPDSKGRLRVDEIGKIRAIWITMFQQCFIADGSEQALNSFVKRQTIKVNGGEGVAEVGWLDSRLAWIVLEGLKQWHRRMMIEAMLARKMSLPERMGYDAIRQAYSKGAA